MPRSKRENKNDDENKILGFLMGLGAGTIVYAFLDLFQKNQKSRCPVCKVVVDKNIPECPNCHSKFRWR